MNQTNELIAENLNFKIPNNNLMWDCEERGVWIGGWKRFMEGGNFWV